MRYMVLIYGDETYMDRLTEGEQRARMQLWMDYSQALQDAGVVVGGDQLQKTATATTVRDRGGEPLVSDGPFAETREQLAGFMVFDLENLDRAIEWAHRCPAASVGTVELRPIQEFEQG